jgi:undecaprenyl-diphosphatase
LAVGTVAFAARRRGTTLLCLVGPALAGLCELLAKPVVDRLNDGSLSYPSGHATLAAALATLIVIVAHQLGGRKTALAAAPSAALPLIVSVAVVRLGWHYPTDVIGGIGLGVGVVCAAAAAVVALEAAARTNRKKTVRTS